MFTREQEDLLEKIKSKSPNSVMWPYQPETKLGDLLDIYAGHYPEIFPRDEALTIEYSKKLIEYCEMEHRMFPETKEKNIILSAYLEKSKQEEKMQEKNFRSRKSESSSNSGSHLPSFLRKDIADNEKNIVDRQQKEKNNTTTSNKKDYIATRNDIAFLIEGHQNEKFSEVRSAVHLAKINGCSYFDIISSYNEIHISESLLKSNEKKQKIIVLSIYLDFVSHGDPQTIVDKLIKAPFHYLFEQKRIDCIPEWVSTLNCITIHSFSQSILNEYFSGDAKRFVHTNESIRKELIDLSNEISFKKLKEYLTHHPEIKIIYGLVGSAHLPMLAPNDSSKESNNYLCTQLMLEGRLINVTLFGGMHGDMDHYEKMSEFVKKQHGFVIPDPESVPKPEVDSETYNMIVSLLLAGSREKKSYLHDSDNSRDSDEDSENFSDENSSNIRNTRGPLYTKNITFFEDAPILKSERTPLLENSKDKKTENDCCFSCNIL